MQTNPNPTPHIHPNQTFNVVSEHLATEAAAALQANKLIFITEGQTLVDTRTGHVIQVRLVTGWGVGLVVFE